MSSIAALIGTVCVCAVVVSDVGIISPNGVTGKTLNLVIGVFIVCVMLLPIKTFFNDFNLNISVPQIPDSISSDARAAYNNAVITETKSRLEKTLLTTLTADGYKVSSVNIKLGEKEDGGIYISGVNIYINKNETHIDKIIRRTEEKFDITPKVTVRQ